ncbi:hypothetical protein C8R44DRAFT_883465 [Mycena epipterygia]|nr:hypothetical protein C8R44DRAFT_883465 [Mycena epipterygia]
MSAAPATVAPHRQHTLIALKRTPNITHSAAGRPSTCDHHSPSRMARSSPPHVPRASSAHSHPPTESLRLPTMRTTSAVHGTRGARSPSPTPLSSPPRTRQSSLDSTASEQCTDDMAAICTPHFHQRLPSAQIPERGSCFPFLGMPTNGEHPEHGEGLRGLCMWRTCPFGRALSTCFGHALLVYPNPY